MRILITGGTGSLGSRITRRLVNAGHTVIVFSRDEQKQFKMRMDYENNLAAANSECAVKFIIGNVQDKLSIQRAMELYRPDIVIHTAAQKHVRVCDENPEQAVLTNIIGTSNMVDACIAYDVKIGCFVSTDKAVEPTTLYGMTKAIAERTIVNAKMRQSKTKFVGVRYGNVANSAGSLIPLYQSIAHSSEKIFRVTHRDMTRFFITFDAAIDLIFRAIELGMPNRDAIAKRGDVELYKIVDQTFCIPLLKSASILDIAKLFAEKYGGKVEIVRPYPSEKLHEVMDPGYSSEHCTMSLNGVKYFLEKENLL